MIQLEVQEYCHRCRDFEASTTKDVLFTNGAPLETNFTIRCAHARHCEALLLYLEEHKKKENQK
jgi:hypothetical protein